MTCRRTILAACFSLATAAVAAANPSASPTVRCADDTLRIHTSDGGRYAVALSAFAGSDTLNMPTEARVWMIDGADSLEIAAAPGFRPLRVTGPRDTLRLWVRHAVPGPDTARIALLRRFARFGAHDARVPRVTYAPPSDSALAWLRAHYALDAVAGNGSEFERLRNLMHWVHVTVPHDGTKPAPAAMDAHSLLAACEGGRATSNCRGIGTVLNEVYLAMGFPSRHLTCLPWDESDPDCHVVNMVWSRSLGKWLYMDATHDAWFADAKGRPLSPREIREAMRRGEPMTLPSQPNWNGQPMGAVVYRNYMTKNFFRFSVPAESRAGYEEFADPVVELHLDPAAFRPEQRTRGAIETSVHVRELHTADADAFWAPPGH